MEIDNFFFLILDFILQKCLLSSPLRFHITFVPIAEFVGCEGDKRGKFSKKDK